MNLSIRCRQLGLSLSLSKTSRSWFFFFSSRRRHTRWTGDWSSDVCSSDLLGRGAETVARGADRLVGLLGVLDLLLVQARGLRHVLRAIQVAGLLAGRGQEIGRASCRERVEISAGPVCLEYIKPSHSTTVAP